MSEIRISQVVNNHNINSTEEQGGESIQFPEERMSKFVNGTLLEYKVIDYGSALAIWKACTKEPLINQDWAYNILLNSYNLAFDKKLYIDEVREMLRQSVRANGQSFDFSAFRLKVIEAPNRKPNNNDQYNRGVIASTPPFSDLLGSKN